MTEAAIGEALRGRRVLVTGHTGFKGSWLALWLHRLGAVTWGYALEPPTRPSLFAVARVEEVLERHVVADVRDAERLQAVFREHRPEVVVHAAAQSLVRPSYRDPKGTFDTNVGGTVNVLEAVRTTGSVRALVIVTSDKVYAVPDGDRAHVETDPLGGRDPYSASKAGAEMAFEGYRRSFFESVPVGAASVRAGNVIGGGDWAADRILPDVVRAVAAGEPVAVRQPDAVRPWQHVLDPLSGYLLLAARLLEDPRDASGAWNFGPEPSAARPVRELVACALDRWGRGEATFGDGGPDGMPETARLRLSSEKARTRLGWSPCWDFERAVAETVDWHRAHARGEDAAELCRDQIERHVRDAAAARSRP